MSAVPARISWAVSVVAPDPADHLVELGCGPGVAAALVCDQLTTGHLIAVDRSATAVARAVARNKAHIEAGRLTVVQSEVDALALPPASIDKVFAMNVNVFWTREPTRELAVLRALLRQNGEIFVLYDKGPTATNRVPPIVAAALKAGGFTNVEVLTAKDGIGVHATSSTKRTH